MAGIEIPIGAPLDQLTKDFKGAETKLKQFESTANTTLSKAGASAGKSTKNFQDFNRVIQDLPYGINGVANNLQQLIPGVGAMSVAVNVLLTAVTFASVGFGAWTRNINLSKKAIDSASLSGEDYAKTLNQVTRAQLAGSQEVAQELTTLDLLYKSYTDNNQTLERRKDAYKELQTAYPAYFGNLKFEKTISEQTVNAYNQLTSAILATARARAAADQITQNTTRQLENEQKLKDLEKAKLKAEQDRIKLGQRIGTGAGQGFGGSQNQSIALQNVNAEKKITDIIRLQNNLKTDSNILTQRNLDLVKEVNTEIAKGAKLTGSVGGKGGPTEKAVRNFLDYTDQGFFNRFAEGVTIKTNVALKKVVSDIDPSIKFPIEQLFPTGDLFSQGEIFKEYLQFDLLPQLGQSFTTFFDDILTKGKISFDALGKAILNTFASVLASEATQGLLNLLGQKGGKEAPSGGGLLGGIAGLLGGGKSNKAQGINDVGNIAKAGAGILGTIIPAAGLALGVVSLLGGLFKKKKKTAEVPVPVQTNSVASTSSINSPVDIAGGRVVFEISGTNLIGVLNRAGAKISRYGI